MKILFITPYTPAPTRVRSYQFVRSLAAMGNTLTVATLAAERADEERLDQLRSRTVEVVWARLPKARSLRNCLTGLPAQHPLQAVYCWQPKLAAALRRLVVQREFDVIHVEHLRGAVYGLDIRRFLIGSSAAPTPIVWDSVDCISRLLGQSSTRAPGMIQRWLSRFELERTRSFESWLTAQFSVSVATTPREAEALRELFRSQRNGSRCRAASPWIAGDGLPAGILRTEPDSREPDIRIVSNGVDLSRTLDLSHQDACGRPVIVMSGRMSYHANMAAALLLVREVMPRVWSRHPQAVVRLIGENPPPMVRRLAKFRPGCVEVTGYVADLRSALRPAAVATAPMPYAVGIQNKVLEAMSCRIPVVATPAVLDGVQARPDEEILIGENAAELANQLLRLLRDSSLRKAIGASGRRYVERNHCWSRKASELMAVYRDACVPKVGR